jgi:hypothetical protein
MMRSATQGSVGALLFLIDAPAGGMADRWQAKLSRPIVMRDGTKLKTLAEAGSFILALPEAFQLRNSWLKATEMLMEAAERKGDIEAATEAVERAGFMQFLWMPGTAAPRSKD